MDTGLGAISRQRVCKRSGVGAITSAPLLAEVIGRSEMLRRVSLHISETIERGADDVYLFASDPSRLPEWAAGLSGSIEHVDGQWIAESPMGRVVVEFAPRNGFGVIDHVVVLPNGVRVYNPMRVIPLGDVSEVVFTLRRQPETTAEDFERDAAAVRADLRSLKAVLECGS